MIEHIRVVTVAFNPGPELEHMLASLGHASSRPYECVIVDNGTEHNLVNSLASRYNAHIVRPGRNLGYGAAANRGAFAHFPSEEKIDDAAAPVEPRWVIVVNPDIRFSQGAIDELIDAAERTGAWVTGPKILTPEGVVYPSARTFPRLVAGTGHALLADLWPSNPFSRRYRQPDLNREQVVDWLSGACLLFPFERYRQLGGFDERFFMFFEDTYLGECVARAGGTSVYVPSATVVHDQGASWRDRPEAMRHAHHQSAALYLSLIYNKPWQAPLRGGIRLGLAGREAAEKAVRRLGRRRSS